MFTIEDVRASFDEPTFRRGFAYARTGRVVRLDEAVGTQFQAQVQGAAPAPYSVTVDIATGEPGPSFSTSCDCPMMHQCKHGAAAAIVFADRDAAKETGVPPGELDAEVSCTCGMAAAASRTFSTSPNAEPPTESIRYLLDTTKNAATVKLRACVVSSLKNGERSIGRAIDLAGLNFGGRGYVTPIDRAIGRLAVASGITNQYTYGPRGANVSPRLLAMLLSEMAAIGRLHWVSPKAPPLARRDLSQQKFAWNMDAGGCQRPGIAGMPSLRLLPSNPTWYVDPVDGDCGTIDLDLGAEAIVTILAAPPLTPRAATARANGVETRFRNKRRSAAAARHRDDRSRTGSRADAAATRFRATAARRSRRAHLRIWGAHRSVIRRPTSRVPLDEWKSRHVLAAAR